MSKFSKLPNPVMFTTLVLFVFGALQCNKSNLNRVIGSSSNYSDVIWSFDLQTGFSKDTIEIRWNNFLLVQNEVVSTDGSSGYAFVNLTHRKKDSEGSVLFIKTFAVSDSMLLEESFLSDTLEIQLTIKRKSEPKISETLRIPLKNGNFIGLSIAFDRQTFFGIMQNDKPYIYY